MTLRSRESRRREAAGRRNYPEAVHNGEGGNGDNTVKQSSTGAIKGQSHRKSVRQVV